MNLSRITLTWLLGFVVFGLLLHLFSPILLPFVTGLLVAYFLDPVVERLSRAKMNRSLATSLVLVFFFLCFGAGLVLLTPLVVAQLLDLARKLPDVMRVLQERLGSVLVRVSSELSPADLERLKGAVGGFAGDALKLAGGLLASIWSGGIALLNLISLIVITPIVAFYLLRDWDKILTTTKGWLPRQHGETIQALVNEADDMIAGFVRGMGLVCLILAAFYGVTLSLVGLEFGLVIGLFAGLLSFVPFVGAIGGFVVAVGMACAQFGDWQPIAIVAAIFVVGQIGEGNFLTPKLVGHRIQLHPVWIIFALLAGGVLLGFVGVLLAVPLAAVIGVLVRFGVHQYLKSPLYLGASSKPGEDGGP